MTALVRGSAWDVDADAVVAADLLDAPGLAAVAAARPEVVLHQVTALRPVSGDTRWEFSNGPHVRRAGTANLVDAARAAGARRHAVPSGERVLVCGRVDRMVVDRQPLYQGFGELVTFEGR